MREWYSGYRNGKVIIGRFGIPFNEGRVLKKEEWKVLTAGAKYYQ
jgi:hypothetical protein